MLGWLSSNREHDSLLSASPVHLASHKILCLIIIIVPTTQYNVLILIKPACLPISSLFRTGCSKYKKDKTNTTTEIQTHIYGTKTKIQFVWWCLLTVLAFLYCIHIDIDNFIIFLVFFSSIVRCCVLSAINKSITYLLTKTHTHKHRNIKVQAYIDVAQNLQISVLMTCLVKINMDV